MVPMQGIEPPHPAPSLVFQLNYSIDLQAIDLQQSTWVDNMVDKSGASYLYQKRGVYYFSKQVPCDVKQHYSRNRIVICLRTKSLSKAMRSCKSILQRLEDYWMFLRFVNTRSGRQQKLHTGKRIAVSECYLTTFQGPIKAPKKLR